LNKKRELRPQLNHRNILVVFDIGQQDESPYICAGRRVRTVIGVFHRDIKPENIFVTARARSRSWTSGW